MTSDHMHQLTIKLPARDLADAKTKAAERGQTISEYVRQALLHAEHDEQWDGIVREGVARFWPVFAARYGRDVVTGKLLDQRAE